MDDVSYIVWGAVFIMCYGGSLAIVPSLLLETCYKQISK